MRSITDVLRRQWNDSGVQLRRRLDGLSDSEFLWEPVPGCWTIRPGPASPGRYQIDYPEPAPDPPPFTTIAWRLVHIANGNWIYWEHAFGAGKLMFPDLRIPEDAESAVQYWLNSREAITDWLETARDDDLRELRPSHMGTPRTAGDVVLILIEEEIHHGAEIALLRDLYREQPSTGS